MEFMIALLICWVAFDAVAVHLFFWREHRRRHSDKSLFLTHTPHDFQVGSIRDGYRITSLERVAPTALVTGVVAPCWQVYGVKANLCYSNNEINTSEGRKK